MELNYQQFDLMFDDIKCNHIYFIRFLILTCLQSMMQLSVREETEVTIYIHAAPQKHTNLCFSMDGIVRDQKVPAFKKKVFFFTVLLSSNLLGVKVGGEKTLNF